MSAKRGHSLVELGRGKGLRPCRRSSDSPLEGDGFELFVPPHESAGFPKARRVSRVALADSNRFAPMQSKLLRTAVRVQRLNAGMENSTCANHRFRDVLDKRLDEVEFGSQPRRSRNRDSGRFAGLAVHQR